MAATAASAISQGAFVHRASLSVAGSSHKSASPFPAPHLLRARRSVRVSSAQRPVASVKAEVAKAVEKASSPLALAAIAATAFPAMPAHAAYGDLFTLDFWAAFWSWRTNDLPSFVLLFIGPFAASYLVIDYSLKNKRSNIKKTIKEQGYYEGFVKLGIDTEDLMDMSQLNFINGRIKKGALDESAMKAFALQVKKSELTYFPEKAAEYEAMLAKINLSDEEEAKKKAEEKTEA